MKKQPIIVVCGPTASGKTKLAVSLAKRLNGEIISADSMQIYKHMQIATAKPTKNEMQGIKHYLIDILEPTQSFSVAEYVSLAKQCIIRISDKGCIPIICGGTGLYINSLIDNIRFDDTAADEGIRAELSDLAERNGGEYLLGILREFDPETASKLHPNNLPRIIRAIEIYRLSGVTMSQAVANSRQESPYSPCMIGINFNDRSKLYERINQRVDDMINLGLVEEARSVLASGQLKTSVQAIGYKELIPYFNGAATLDECIDKLKMETRRYAKRQLTWFRRDERINWIYPDMLNDNAGIVDRAMEIIEESCVLRR